MGVPAEPGDPFDFVQPPDLPGVAVTFVERSRRTVRMFPGTCTSAIVPRGERARNCDGACFPAAHGSTVARRPGDVHACLEPTATFRGGILVLPDRMHAVAREPGMGGELKVELGRSARAKRHVDAHCARSVDLAEGAGLGRFQFIRAFKAETGFADPGRRTRRFRRCFGAGAGCRAGRS